MPGPLIQHAARRAPSMDVEHPTVASRMRLRPSVPDMATSGTRSRISIDARVREVDVRTRASSTHGIASSVPRPRRCRRAAPACPSGRRRPPAGGRGRCTTLPADVDVVDGEQRRPERRRARRARPPARAAPIATHCSRRRLSRAAHADPALAQPGLDPRLVDASFGGASRLRAVVVDEHGVRPWRRRRSSSSSRYTASGNSSSPPMVMVERFVDWSAENAVGQFAEHGLVGRYRLGRRRRPRRS